MPMPCNTQCLKLSVQKFKKKIVRIIKNLSSEILGPSYNANLPVKPFDMKCIYIYVNLFVGIYMYTYIVQLHSLYSHA